MLDIAGVPFDECGRRPGSRLGPIAVRMAGLLEELQKLGVEARHSGLIGPALSGETYGHVTKEERMILAARNLPDVLAEVKAWSAGVCRTDAIPVMIGGDHSLSMGSISGALERYGDRLAVLWIDAHVDLNTPRSSPSGNMHGMPLGALARLEDEAIALDTRPTEGEMAAISKAWDRILSEVIPAPGLAGHRMAWLGLRDVDLGESRNLTKLQGELALTMEDIDREGITGSLNQLKTWLEETKPSALWVSFDVDSLDPFFAPGTGTAVRGGLTYREGQLIAETLNRWLLGPDAVCPLAGLDVVEVNPLADHSNETAIMAAEWTASLFGKTIMRRRELEMRK